MDSKVCLTTFIFGDKYQDYIPLLVYSVHKAYPEYFIILFLHGKLRADIKKQLHDCDLYHNLSIKEDIFADCPKMNPLKSKALRWILWDDIFNEYDYLYTVDIDMFYVKEPQSLHVQHIQHMKTTKLSFDNIRRIYKKSAPLHRSIMQRIKHAGFKSFIKYLIHYNQVEYKLSGLHFVDIKSYYSVFDEGKRNYYKHQIYTSKYLKNVMSPNNEILLHEINKSLGFDLTTTAIQTDEVTSLNFNDTERAEFRPHHGIHLGIFRTDNNLLPISSKKILDSPAYKHYVEVFKKEIQHDPKFIQLSKTFNDNLKTYFSNFYRYYSIIE